MLIGLENKARPGTKHLAAKVRTVHSTLDCWGNTLDNGFGQAYAIT